MIDELFDAGILFPPIGYEVIAITNDGIEFKAFFDGEFFRIRRSLNKIKNIAQWKYEG